MPLSRNFYSLDEIEAALFYTTTNNNPSEALYWAEELILSGCIGDAISILFKSWLWNTGPMRLQWLLEAYKTLSKEDISEEEILLATYRLATIPHKNRDNSLWNILVLTAQNPNEMPDSVTRKTPNVIPSEDEKEVYFVRAIFQGKARSAWWISQYIETDRVWVLLDWVAENIHTKYTNQYKLCLDTLKNYEQLLGYTSAEYDVIIRCAAVIMMCIWLTKQDESFSPLVSEIDKLNLDTLNEWSLSVGRRNHRVYQIPNACLYGTTLRGRMKWTQNNLIQLYDIEKHLVGSPYWDEILTEYADVTENGEIKWMSDDKMEEFYEKYFPNDIPDEWSKKEKEKSHGAGILGPNEKPTIWKYSRNFMNKNPKLAWNTTKSVNNYLEKVDISDCSIERIIELYKSPLPLSDEDLKKLEPVRKIKIL